MSVYPEFRPSRAGRLSAQVEWLRQSKGNALAVPSEARKREIVAKYGADIADQILVPEERLEGVEVREFTEDSHGWIRRLFGIPR